jgi:hypothetical protein
MVEVGAALVLRWRYKGRANVSEFAEEEKDELESVARELDVGARELLPPEKERAEVDEEDGGAWSGLRPQRREEDKVEKMATVHMVGPLISATSRTRVTLGRRTIVKQLSPG